MIAGNCRGTDDHGDAGAVNGIVTDDTNGVVPGVSVNLSGPSLIITQTDLTDEEAAYRFSAVLTGDHTLTLQLAGFATVVREAVATGKKAHG